MPNYQLSFPLIQHTVGVSVVPQREHDGYVNATAMCKACGKQFNHYISNATTKAFIEELSSVTGIPGTGLVQIIQGGTPQLQGTWVHPLVAYNLGQWASAKFAVLVSQWIDDWKEGKQKPKTVMPPHILRHQMNMAKIPVGFFSVLQEMTYTLVAPLEAQGYSLPSNLMPDISQGKMFCQHLRDVHGINTNGLNTYTHSFPDGRTVKAKLYPLEYLVIFRQLMAQQWLPQAENYFKKRDANALPAIQQLLQITYNPPSNSGMYKIKA